MMNCKQASQLISRDLDEVLSARERFALKFHLFLCKYCSRFSQQLKALHVAISSMSKNIEDDANVKLPSETKKKIVKSLESKD
jgi:Putative zinc-finger